METEKDKKDKVIQVVKEKFSRLPLGFIIGAAIGGGLYLYATKSRGSKSVNAITNVTKLAAPYVIIAILDKLVDSYETNRSREIEEAEVEVK